MTQVQSVENAGHMSARKKRRFIRVRSTNPEVMEGRTSVVVTSNGFIRLLHIQNHYVENKSYWNIVPSRETCLG